MQIVTMLWFDILYIDILCFTKPLNDIYNIIKIERAYSYVISAKSSIFMYIIKNTKRLKLRENLVCNLRFARAYTQCGWL